MGANKAILAACAAAMGASSGVAVTITTQLDAQRVIQRTSKTGGGQGLGQASVQMALSFTGTQPIYCRRRSYADGATILQTPWLAKASATTGTITLSGIDVPAINSAATAPVVTHDGWFYLDVATSASGPWTNGTSQVTAGRLISISGQSLADRMFNRQADTSNTNASLGVTITPYCSVLATWGGETTNYLPTVSTMPWAVPVDGGEYNSTFASEFLRRQAQTFGAPCGIIGHAFGGTAISTYFSGGSNDTTYSQVVAKAGGAWEAAIWYQGHSEAAYGLPDLPYGAALATVWARHLSLNSLTPAKYTGSIPNIESTTSWGTPFQRHYIRKAHNSWAAANGATHVQISDLTQIDGIHENQIGAIPMAQHFHRATKAELSLRGDLGPALVSATRVGTTITVTLSNVGQGNLVLTGTPGNRIHAFPAGFFDSRTQINQNRFSVSSVSVTNATTLSITLANDPGDATVLNLYFYWANDPTSTAMTDMIRDDQTDGDGIAVGRQVVPNYDPIVIAAPNPAGASNAPPGGLVTGTSPWNMTATSPTYGAQEETAFNQTMSGGTAVAAANSTPTFTGYTAECWFTCPTIPASTQVFLGGIGSDYIGLNSSGKITCNGGTGSTTLVAGKRYHCAYQRGSAGTQVFLTDVTDATAGTREVNNTSAVTTVPGSSAFSIRNHGGSFALSGGTVDECAVFQNIQYTPTNTTYTCPTAPFVGTETGLVALYHLDGSVLESVCW